MTTQVTRLDQQSQAGSSLTTQVTRLNQRSQFDSSMTTQVTWQDQQSQADSGTGRGTSFRYVLLEIPMVYIWYREGH